VARYGSLVAARPDAPGSAGMTAQTDAQFVAPRVRMWQ
jgi:hypothetical protein